MKKQIFGYLSVALLLVVQGCSWGGAESEVVLPEDDKVVTEGNDNSSDLSSLESKKLCPYAEVVEKGNEIECENNNFDEETVLKCKGAIFANKIIQNQGNETLCEDASDENVKKYCKEYIDESLLESSVNYFQQGDFDKAIEEVDKILKKEANSNKAKIFKAQVLSGKASTTYDEENSAQEVLQILEEVLATEPNNVEALSVKGYSYEIRNMFEPALESYKQAMKLDPLNPDVLNQIGHVYDLQGKKDEARKYYLKANKQDGANVSVMLNLARNYLSNQQPARAEILLNKASKKETNVRAKAEMYSLSAAVALSKDVNDPSNYKKARDLYDKAVEADDTFALGFAGRGWMSFLMLVNSQNSEEENNNNLNLSLKDIDKAIELNPEQTIAYFYKAKCLEVMGDIEGSTKLLNKALSIVETDITLMEDEKDQVKQMIEFYIQDFSNRQNLKEEISFNMSDTILSFLEPKTAYAYMNCEVNEYCITDSWDAFQDFLSKIQGHGGYFVTPYYYVCNNGTYAKYEPPCEPSCECATNVCEWENCEDGCGGNCAGEKKEKGTSECAALETLECGDPYTGSVEERRNWGGEWNNFDQITNPDWVNQGKDWCLAVAGRRPTSGETADCWTLECHKVVKCTGTQCARGADGALCGLDDKTNPTAFVWADAETANWCVPDSYGANPDPNVICNSKCPSESTVLALFDGTDPNITAYDQEGRQLDPKDETISETEILVATAGELVSADTEPETLEQEETEHWYNVPVKIKPECADPDPEKISKFLLCDKSGQKCTADPSYPTAEACFKARSISGVQSCKEIQEYKSECEAGTDKSTEVLNHKESGTVSQKDRAGNEGTFETEALNIDYNAPDMEKLKVSVLTVGFAGGDDAEVNLFPSPNADEALVAHDKYKIKISMEDSSCIQKNCASGQSDSGISGIDWSKSKIVIKDAADTTDTVSYTFGTTGNEDIVFTKLTGDFKPDTANFTEKVELSFTGGLFHKAGSKTMYLVFQDKAGNVSQQNIDFEINPGIASKVKLDSAQCGQVIANNDDECEVRVAIWDIFENAVINRKVKLKDVAEQEIGGSYDLKEDPQQAFANGIRMSDIETMSAADVDGYVGVLPIRSLVPTMYFKTKTIGDDSVMYADKSRGEELDGVDARLVDLVIEVENVNGASQPTGVFTEFSEGNDVDLTFLPWVYLKVTNKSNCADASDPVEISLGNEALDVNLCATVGSNGGIQGRSLPGSFQAYVLGHSPEGTDFKNEVIDEDLIGQPGQVLSFLNTNQKSFATRLQAAGDGNLGDLSDIAITSDVELKVAEKDGLSGTKTVEYPGGDLGATNGFEAYLIGADIEGGILGEEFAYEAETEIVNIGGVSGDDIREELIANTYTMLRTKTAISDEGELKAGFTFSDKEVKYYKGDVEIGGEIAGVGTVVIEDGNLFINKNMNYGTSKASLGVILINSNIKPNPETGNIYIDPAVKNVVGTYYADGSLFSGNPSNKINYKDGGNYQAKLRRQLLLEGTIFTKNTLGGSLGEGDSTDYYTPWGQLTSLDKAREYDLHFIRRYSKGLVPSDNCQDEATNEDVSCNGYCVPLTSNGDKCDRNPHAFVIRPDGRVKISPPPGFDNMGSIGR